jgi:hypothetical protein
MYNRAYPPAAQDPSIHDGSITQAENQLHFCTFSCFFSCLVIAGGIAIAVLVRGRPGGAQAGACSPGGYKLSPGWTPPPPPAPESESRISASLSVRCSWFLVLPSGVGRYVAPSAVRFVESEMKGGVGGQGRKGGEGAGRRIWAW